MVGMPQDFADGLEFSDRLIEIYGKQMAAAIQLELARSRSTATFWINPLVAQGAIPESSELSELPGMQISMQREKVTRSDAAQRGGIYIQNPSSLLAVQLLCLQTGIEVLDLAAAPGGKTIAMAAAMNNTGRIAAVEPIAARFHRLRSNVARCGVENVAFYQRDGRGVGRAVPNRFDRVLLDAPCTSEARMRWDNPATYKHWQLRKIKEMQRKQKALLMSGYQALKPGGQLVYCTCAFSPEENEMVVHHLLKRTEARLLPIRPEELPGNHMPGHRGWRARKFDMSVSRSVRIIPRGAWDGFYVARFTKPG
jgi:16S rRNA (cytosine1407-C5)-methyltransferase